MKIIVFDTETISLTKQFIYNLGYVIYDTETGEVLKTADYIIDQIWNNKPLFETGYYANKRPKYVSRLKGKHAVKIKWGIACRRMAKDIKDYNIKHAYAYNSTFDEKAFYFMHCFYRNKTRPLDAVIVHDIMDELKYVDKVGQQSYKDYAKERKLVTTRNVPKKTAEAVYKYISGNADFIEDHMGLSDSLIELEILVHCKRNAAAPNW